MEQNQGKTNSKAGKGLGIAGLVLGILAAIISFIPCLGMYAFIPGFIGLILSLISFVQANKAGATKGLAIAGIVCSVIGCSIAAWQYVQITSAVKEGLENIDASQLK